MAARNAGNATYKVWNPKHDGWKWVPRKQLQYRPPMARLAMRKVEEARHANSDQEPG
jgi:hypothetical protein